MKENKRTIKESGHLILFKWENNLGSSFELYIGLMQRYHSMILGLHSIFAFGL